MGYFSDSKFDCEVFHYCQPDGTRNTFHCPTDSIFNQLSMVCEDKSVLNTRICKEGTIGTKKELKTSKKTSGPAGKTSPKKKYSGDLSNHRSHKSLAHLTPTKPISRFALPLEDLLSYMNIDQQAQASFVTPTIAKLSDKPSSSVALITRGTTSDPYSSFGSRKISKPMVTTTVSLGSSYQTDWTPNEDKILTTRAAPDVLDDTSVEYDAIEGRKPRKHKRVGKVLDFSEPPRVNTKRQKHSHVSARSPTDSPPEDDILKTTFPPTTTTTASPSNGSLRLFSANRSRAKDFRKNKRRNLNRRKPSTTTENGNNTDIAPPETTTEMQPTDVTTIHGLKRKKSRYGGMQQSESIVSQSWLGYSEPGKVEPYTLPPLPTSEFENLFSSTQENEQNENSEEENKNPWYVTTEPTTDDIAEAKFGEKITDSEHQQRRKFRRKKILPETTDDTEAKKSSTLLSDDTSAEEYYEQPKPSIRKTPTRKLKFRNSRRLEDKGFYNSHSTTKPEDLFPPPRAEPREQKSSHRQQLLFITDSNEDEKEILLKPTESPSKSTTTYIRKYKKNSRTPDDNDGHQWKLVDDTNKKIEVGSIFSSHTALNKLSSPRKKFLATTKLPDIEDSIRADELPKHFLAQQHLLKLMNDFFATTSATSNSPENWDVEEEAVTPSYKVADIMEESESINEEMEEIPSDLLEVVDFIAEQSDEEDQKEDKSGSTHEIIKINGPITDAHLKEILSERGFEIKKKGRKESVKKFFIVPDKEKEDKKELAELAQFASLRLIPLAKHLKPKRQPVTVMPMKTENSKKQPAIVTAKKVPVRVFYKNHMSETVQQKVVLPKPELKIIRSRLPNPSLQVIQNGKVKQQRTYSQPHPIPQPPIILQSPSIYPPHPPPLHKKSPSFKFGFPFVAGGRSLLPSFRKIQGRKKRSVQIRSKRQMRPPFLPFPRSVFPAFNPKFIPTFSPFKSIFSPNGLHTSGSSLAPFSFSMPNPQIRTPPGSPSRPVPVRHVTQAGHQTVIVEEVPVPIHVEVPDPNLVRPVPSGTHPAPILSRYPNNQYRSPPALQTPPLVQRPQGSYPQPNYRPFGMPSDIRPPIVNYQPSVPFPQQLNPNPGPAFGLNVPPQPYHPRQQIPPNGPNSIQGVIANSQPAFTQYGVHANSYPNFQYFQSPYATTISDEPVPGRIMYSGYKPPKTTAGTKMPKTTRQQSPPRKERPNENKRPHRQRTIPPPSGYYTVTPSAVIGQYVQYHEVPNQRGTTSRNPKTSMVTDYPGQNSAKTLNTDHSVGINDSVPRKRKPGRRRRPRPPQYISTTEVVPASNDISPTPPPPEQIPAPPAEYTSKPLHRESSSYSQTPKDNFKAAETSSLYPPAGYYGKDQVVQFFERPQPKAPASKYYQQNDLGESTASAEVEESVTSYSEEDPDQPVYGARLKTNDPRQSKKRRRQHIPSPTQQTEIRVNPGRTMQNSEGKKEGRFFNSNDRKLNNPEEENKSTSQTEKRRRPVYRAKSRPTSPSKQTGSGNFKHDGNFYNVPRGLQNLVAPSQKTSQSNTRGADMFGIPHPVIDHSIYSYRPEGAPIEFTSSFFSVPPELAKQHESSVREMNMKAIPESARNFFSAPADVASKFRDIDDTNTKNEQEENKSLSSPEEKKEQGNQAVRKLRKPKRKNRYNPRNNNDKENSEVTATKSRPESTQSIREKTTTPSTTTEPRPIYSPKPTTTTTQPTTAAPEPVFKPRSPLLPKTLPDFSKSLLNGKLDIKKLNATISTSVSVSGPFQQADNTSSEETSNKKVFTSQNGGLAVVRRDPKRKRKQKYGADANEHFGSDSESNAKAKYEIAASVLDIIKATTEAEKQGGSGFYSNNYDNGEKSAASKISNSWAENPSLIAFENKRIGVQ
nr:uncharacterized protein LOC107447809 [Parasteatoda tepidariorum]